MEMTQFSPFKYRIQFDRIHSELFTTMVDWLRINIGEIRNTWDYEFHDRYEILYFKRKKDRVLFQLIYG